MGLLIELVLVAIGFAVGGITGAIIAWLAWEVIATIIYNHS